MLYGNGLRTTVVDAQRPAVAGLRRRSTSRWRRRCRSGHARHEVRFDVMNVFDNSYQMRDGSGVGVGAPQFGLRRPSWSA